MLKSSSGPTVTITRKFLSFRKLKKKNNNKSQVKFTSIDEILIKHPQTCHDHYSQIKLKGNIQKFT